MSMWSFQIPERLLPLGLKFVPELLNCWHPRYARELFNMDMGYGQCYDITAILRVDIEFYIGARSWFLLKS